MQENPKKKKQEEANEYRNGDRNYNRRGFRAGNLPGNSLLEQGEQRMSKEMAKGYQIYRERIHKEIKEK